MIAAQVHQKMHAKEVAATTLLAKEDESVAEMMERTATADAIAAVTPRSTADTTAPFASRINRRMKPNMLMLHTLVQQRHLLHTLGARLTSAPTKRAFRLL